MNLRALDLNLLVVFDALMQERHVTRAAARVGLSQPAFSNALTRLRERLEDELFIRGPEGMRPTPRATDLAAPIRSALAEIEGALDGAAFDPARSRRSFTIVAIDYAAIVLLPALMERMVREAPGVTLRVTAALGQTAEQLDSQAADLALIIWSEPPERFSRETILDDRWVCMMRDEHPLAGGPLTVADYAAADHLLVSPRGDQRGWVDDSLEAQGLSRRVAAVVAGYAGALLTVRRTDLLLTCPRRIGEALCQPGLTLVDAPLPSARGNRTLDMIWHERLGRHPAHVWLREIVREVAADVRG